MTSSRRVNVRLNGDPLMVVDCFKYLGSQVAADVGCERDLVHKTFKPFRSCGLARLEMDREVCPTTTTSLHRLNDKYKAWGAPKSVLSSRALGISAISVCTATALYGAET